MFRVRCGVPDCDWGEEVERVFTDGPQEDAVRGAALILMEHFEHHWSIAHPQIPRLDRSVLVDSDDEVLKRLLARLLVIKT